MLSSESSALEEDRFFYFVTWGSLTYERASEVLEALKDDFPDAFIFDHLALGFDTGRKTLEQLEK